MKIVRPHSPLQYLRIFVIVHLISFGVSKTALDAYYKPVRPQSQQIRRKPSSPLPVTTIPSFQSATDALQSARSGGPQSGSNSNDSSRPSITDTEHDQIMAPRGKTENTKKVAGNAKKAEAAAQKQAAADNVAEREETGKWAKGAKATDKAAAAADKKAQQAAAKAERDRLLAEEEKNQPAKGTATKNKKTAEKKSRGTLNLDDLDSDPSTDNRERTINATGIDNALDALSLTNTSNADKVERHPERRFKAAYKAFEERRLPEIEAESPGLRRNQRQEQARKEFERHPDNPFNQTSVGFDASKDEIREMKKAARDGVEGRLGEK